ncbi:hypothetical protein J560_4457, partial [Acinetobacter baumannii 855125]
MFPPHATHANRKSGTQKQAKLAERSLFDLYYL